VIRFQNLLREPRTYEIPLSAGAGHVRQDVTRAKRSLVRPTDKSAPAGSFNLHATMQTHSRVLPKSVTLMAAGTEGDTSEPLPDHVQHVPPFKALIQQRALKVVLVADPKVETEPKAGEKPAKRESSKPENKTEKVKRGDK
jgi:hypothetical protein